jgi:TPR repeat protein
LAVKYFKLAIKSGTCARAFNNLGICYEFGSDELKSQNLKSEEKTTIEKDLNYAA